MIDIDLAIERVLLNSLILKQIYLKNKFNMDEFCVPAYTLDFSHVVLLTPVCCTVRITNYTSIKIDVRLDKKTLEHSLEFDEFKIEFRYKRLEIGESMELFVLFKPTRRRYGLNETKVENLFCLRLKQGGCIPIKVKAVVTMPKLTLEQTSIDFGNVIFGEATRKSIALKNE